MMFPSQLFNSILLVAAHAAVGSAAILLILYKTSLTRWGATLLLLIASNLGSYFLLLHSIPSGLFHLSFDILIIGYFSLGPVWLFFVVVLCGYKKWINWISITVIMSPVALIILGILTYQSPELGISPLASLPQDLGWFHTFFIIYSIFIAVGSTSLLIASLFKSKEGPYSWTILLTIGTVTGVFLQWLEIVHQQTLLLTESIPLWAVFFSICALLSIAWIWTETLVPAVFAAVFENSRNGILMLDTHDNVVYMNAAAIRLMGRKDQSPRGKSLSEAWHQGAMLIANLSNEINSESKCAVSVNGLDATFLVNSVAVFGSSHVNIGRRITFQNLSNREQIEQALEQRTQELERTEKLVMALSITATYLSGASGTEQGFEILGKEMRKLGLSCGIVSIDAAEETAAIQYLSFHPNIIRTVEKITGFSAKNHVIPKSFWPGDRLLKEKTPVWYSNPREKIHQMFPHMPVSIATRVFQMLDISSTGQICILPLLMDEKVIGALPIWGSDLQPKDDPVLMLFASQVAGILRHALAHERDVKRANELARSNTMLLALSKVATLMENSVNSEVILETLGSEFTGLGLYCGIITLDSTGEMATIKYLSFQPSIIQTLENITGITTKGYTIPKQYWPNDTVIREKVSVWYSDPRKVLLEMFPQFSHFVARKALDLLNFRLGTQLCILPLISREQTIGIMTVWGVDIHPSDETAFAVFASQVAGILQNAFAYDIESERVKELARSNLMILALSKVAAQLESSVDSDMIIDTVGNELKKIGMDSIVGILDKSKHNMQIKYMSIKQDVIHWAERMSGISLNDMVIPRHLWPTEKVITEKVVYWDPNLMRGTLKMFPVFPERFLRTAMKMAGINLNDPVCYLPLANEHEVIGILAVWGTGLKRNDETALSVLANQLTTAIRNSDLYENESRRAKELSILLETSDATSSSSLLSDILLSLAAKLRELSEFETCFISEWDPETNQITGLVDHSRVVWNEKERDSYSLREYPSSLEVLRTGKPTVIQGSSTAEEMKWMKELGRTAVTILPLKAHEKNIGLVEIATTKEDHLFNFDVIEECLQILNNRADALVEPLSANSPALLFSIETELLKASGGEICSFSEWDQLDNRILTVAVSTDMSWEFGQSTKRFPEDNPALKLALYEGKASILVCSETNPSIAVINDGDLPMKAESMIIFPLLQGDKNIGLIEIYDFNHRKTVTADQVALLRTVADKASYSIQNARLLQQTQLRLIEKTRLLDEKDVLLKEVHHRVKNNLQIISSLLNLQSAKISEPSAIDVFRESQNRVRTMGLIHEKLYQSANLAQIDFASYLHSLANFLLQSYRGKSENTVIEIDAEKIALDIDRAIPCGLIVNELLSNSLKYAFPNGQGGRISIELKTGLEHQISLRIMDNGIGLPTDFNPNDASTLGLQLVRSLVAQLDGNLETQSINGASFQIFFNY